MKIKSLVKLGLGAITATILLSGCAGSVQRYENISIELPKSNISEKSKNEILKNMVGNNGYIESDIIEYSFIRYTSKSQTRINSQAKMRVQFFVQGNEIKSKDLSNCGERNCSAISHFIDVKDFYAKVEEVEMQLQNNFSDYLNEYEKSESTINSWLQSAQKDKPKFKINIKEKVDNGILSKLENSVSYTKTNLLKEEIFTNFKKSQNNNLTEYLKNYPLYEYNPYAQIIKDRYKTSNFSGYERIKSYVTQNNINNVEINTLSKNNILFNYKPDIFSAENSIIKVELKSDYYGYSAIIYNKTSDFIDVQTLTLYFGDDVLSTPINIKLAPKAKTLSNNITIKTKFEYYQPIDKVFDFGIAVEYSKKGKKENLYIKNAYSEKTL